jgi:hypothetical protein
MPTSRKHCGTLLCFLDQFLTPTQRDGQDRTHRHNSPRGPGVSQEPVIPPMHDDLVLGLSHHLFVHDYRRCATSVGPKAGTGREANGTILRNTGETCAGSRIVCTSREYHLIPISSKSTQRFAELLTFQATCALARLPIFPTAQPPRSSCSSSNLCQPSIPPSKTAKTPSL